MLDQMAQDLRYLFLNKQNGLMNWINYLSLFLVVWALIPEAIYYNWYLWMAVMALWLLLVLIQQKRQLFELIFRRGMGLLAVWPGYTLFLWLIGRGVLHRKFIVIALMMAVGLYYLTTDHRRELAILAKIGTALLTLIAATTLVQMISYPQISRQLAAGRTTGNYLASALLASFQSVYGIVLVVQVMTGLVIGSGPTRKRLLSGLPLLLLVLLAGYDIAVISLVIGLGLLILHFVGMRRQAINAGRRLSPVAEWMGTSGLYVTPAVAMLLMKPAVFRLIDAMDYQTLPMSEQLFNRIWVYLRSIYLFLEFPVFGFGIQPDPTSFLSGQHSDYFDLLAEYGLVGFMVFLLSWVGLLMIIRNRLPQEHRGTYWIGVIVFQIIFMLNPVLEVSVVAVLSIVLPGLILNVQPGSRLRGVR